MDDVEVVHSRLFAFAFATAEQLSMSPWSSVWATDWETVLVAVRLRLDNGHWNSPAESAAAIWAAGAMIQPAGVDGNKRMAAGVMEAQLAVNGYRLVTEHEQIADMTLDIVDLQKRGIDRDEVVERVATWIDDVMAPLDAE